MFGSNSPCPLSVSDYLPPFNMLDANYYSDVNQQSQHPPMQVDSSETEYHSSAPPTPDIISGIMSLTGPASCSSEMSSGSFTDITSPEEYHSTSPPGYTSQPIDISRVQATRSKLIKEGLKLTIQSKRLINGLDNVQLEYRQPNTEELTKEDEERRRRRRERNKVAATKCRNKKKERTGRLAEESETLEVNNNTLRKEIHSLESERKQLLNLLHGHLPHCGLPAQRNGCSRPQYNAHPPSWQSAVH